MAVKVFRPGAEPRTEDRLAWEAVLPAGLQHPGLVTVCEPVPGSLPPGR